MHYNPHLFIEGQINFSPIKAKRPTLVQPQTTAMHAQYSIPSHSDVSPSHSCASDYFQGVFEYLNQMLMEEDDLDNKPCMLADSLALQATEQSFYDVLVNKQPSSPDQDFPFQLHYSDCDYGSITQEISSSSSYLSIAFSSLQPNLSIQQCSSCHPNYFLQPDQTPNFEPILSQSALVNYSYNFQPNLNCLNTFGDSDYSHSITPNSSKFRSYIHPSHNQENFTHFLPVYNDMNCNVVPWKETFRTQPRKENGTRHSPNMPRRKRDLYQEISSIDECQSHKQLASFSEESEQLEIYDKVLLCPRMNPQWRDESKASSSFPEDKNELQDKSKRGGRARGEKIKNRKEMVDLKSLLLQCSHAVANNNISSVNELLKEIRQHSTPYGDSIERMAHYFCNAIDARLAGMGTALYRAFSSDTISAAQILKSYQAYIRACPFSRMSNIFANKSIGKLAEGREKLHIVDFGIGYGFQWPCVIQGLSLRLGGHPKLKITGIDLPQPGLRPAARVLETGNRLANYYKRFNVPFEYNAIAKKWESIQNEDLKIDREEMLVVNCIYRLRNVPDERLLDSRSRDMVLNLIKEMNPDMFVLGVLNGRYDGPFFLPRFKEAFSHFSTLFDMFEATAPREDKDRFIFEHQVLGRDVMNVIACEGTSRVERPEPYKKWQDRIIKAGFRQLPLYPEIVDEVREKVKLDYHKDFVADEDNNWMLQGWKGRVLYALSLWKPVEE